MILGDLSISFRCDDVVLRNFLNLLYMDWELSPNTEAVGLQIDFYPVDAGSVLKEKQHSLLASCTCIPLEENFLLGSSVLINCSGKWIDSNQETAGVYSYKSDYYCYILEFKTSRCLFYYSPNFYDIFEVAATLIRKIIAQYGISCGYYPLHASAVCKGDKGALLLGVSNAGKTTAAVTLAAVDGYELLNDEIVFWNGISLFALPSAAKVHRSLVERYHLDSCTDLAALRFDEETLLTHKQPQIRWQEKCTPALLVVLNRSDDADKLYRRALPSHEAMQRLIESNLQWYYDGHTRRVYQSFWNLQQSVRKYELCYPLEHLFDVPGQIDWLTESA